MIRFVGEIGANHNKDKLRLLNLIETAKDIGCDAVKLQAFDERLGRTPEEKSTMKDRMLPKEFVPIAYDKCRKLKLGLHCSVFHPDFVEFLDPYMDEFKVGSYELLWLDLINTCARTRKPLGISTGGGTEEEIYYAYNKAALHIPKELITMYHCVPFYPTDPMQSRLYKIPQLTYNYPNSFVGYSDHTTSPRVIRDAVIAGAKEIEFHIDLEDRQGSETYHGHCWIPFNAKAMIDEVKSLHKIEEYVKMRAARTNPKDGMRGMG